MRSVFLLWGLVALAAAGCGDDSGSAPASTSTSQPAETAALHETYFQQLATLDAELESELEAVKASRDRVLLDQEADEDDGFSAIRQSYLDYAAAYRHGIDRYESLTPSGEVMSAHEEFIAALGAAGDWLDAISEHVNAAGTPDAFQAVLEGTAGAEIQSVSNRLKAACFALETAAGAAGTMIGLDCLADSARIELLGQRRQLDEIPAFSLDADPVFVTVTLDYAVSTTDIQWLFLQLGPLWFERAVSSRVHNYVKEEIAQFATVDLSSSPEVVAESLRARLAEDLAPFSITVQKLTIESITFSDE